MTGIHCGWSGEHSTLVPPTDSYMRLGVFVLHSAALSLYRSAAPLFLYASVFKPKAWSICLMILVRVAHHPDTPDQGAAPLDPASNVRGLDHDWGHASHEDKPVSRSDQTHHPPTLSTQPWPSPPVAMARRIAPIVFDTLNHPIVPSLCRRF